MNKARESVRARNDFETEHETKYGSMPALRFRRLVCSQILQLRPGIQNMTCGDAVVGCGEAIERPVVDAAHGMVVDAVDALTSLEERA
eukprot:SAG22_NODE_18682_length_283_cov_0.559783_1_plen_87_part_01